MEYFLNIVVESHRAYSVLMHISLDYTTMIFIRLVSIERFPTFERHLQDHIIRARRT